MGSNPQAFAGRKPELSNDEVREFMQMLEKLRNPPFSLSNRYIGARLGYADGSTLGMMGQTRPADGRIVRPSREKLEKMRELVVRHEQMRVTAQRPPLEKTDLPREAARTIAPRTGVLNHLDRANAALTSALKELDEARALSVPLLQPGIIELRSRLASLRGWLEVA